MCLTAQLFSHVQLFATPGAIAHQDPLSMEFPRQECRSVCGLSFPPPGDCPNPGIKVVSLSSPGLAVGFFTTVPPKFGEGWICKPFFCKIEECKTSCSCSVPLVLDSQISLQSSYYFSEFFFIAFCNIFRVYVTGPCKDCENNFQT